MPSFQASSHLPFWSHVPIGETSLLSPGTNVHHHRHACMALMKHPPQGLKEQETREPEHLCFLLPAAATGPGLEALLRKSSIPQPLKSSLLVAQTQFSPAERVRSDRHTRGTPTKSNLSCGQQRVHSSTGWEGGPVTAGGQHHGLRA